MAIPTNEQKALFLEYIKSGDDRGTAARRIGLTGSSFRSLCNPRSKNNYDPEFAAMYDAAVEERGDLDPDRERPFDDPNTPSTVTANGFTKGRFLTDKQLADFLDLVRDGTQAATAAGMIDPPTSITQINRRATKDPEFASSFREAKEEGYLAYKDNLRAEATRQAFAGDYRALRDQMLIHLEEARALMTSRHEVGGLDGGAIRLLAERHFSELPREMLDEMIKTLEERELGQIGAGS